MRVTNYCKSCINHNEINGMCILFTKKMVDVTECEFYKDDETKTVEEVLEEMEQESLNPYFDYGFDLYTVTKTYNGYYTIDEVINGIILGAYVFSKETADRFRNELNEIIGADKK